jgi:hypothetical protein
VFLGALYFRPGYAWGVRSLARADEPERHRGTVLRLHASVFAPPGDVLRFVRPGASNVDAFRVEDLRRLRALWRNAPDAFLGLIALATRGGGLTIVDDFGEADRTPRRILAAALKQLAKTRQDEARRRGRRSAQPPPRRAPPAAS